MKGKLLTLLVVAVLGTSLGMSSGWAQGDLAKALVGKWEGDVQFQNKAADSNRTLIIESVEQKDGKWVATGRFGVTGKGLGKVKIEVDDSSGRLFIRFVTRTNAIVRLSLIGPKDLTGTLTVPAVRLGEKDDPMRLERKD